MPLQNRVDPWGRLHAVEARGAWMGNRGVLHDASKRIVRSWKLKAWIVCRLEFKGRRRQVFSPGRYSELFFLDEATALAAGHRPCAECNRERFSALKRAWGATTAGEIDDALHAQRIRQGEKTTFNARLEELPVGAIVERDGGAFLVGEKALHPWSFGGYGAALPMPDQTPVRVLTPQSMVRALRQGYRPQIHPTSGTFH